MITLLTDFGTQDAYVGIIKGILASCCPTTPVIDLTHAIPPQDRWAARFQLLSAFPYFPPSTIHLVVVDPGVGTHRRAIALRLVDGILVGADNGIFSGVCDRSTVLHAVELTEPAYWRTPNPSYTFHGRDIFAPVAAHLASGVPFEAIGSPIDPASLIRLDLPPLISTNQGLAGCIQYIDHFGNAVTTIPADQVSQTPWQIAFGPMTFYGATTYGQVAPGTPLALVGSHGFIELAVSQGNAQRHLGLTVGDVVVLVKKPGG